MLVSPPMAVPRAASAMTPPAGQALLADLYCRQMARCPENGYLREHARDKVIAAQVRSFFWYRTALPARPRVLEWGAQHGPDGCLIRAAYGEQADLHACDFVPPGQYEVFAGFASASYQQLTDPVRLPHEADSFDAVIASGVLEHTARDYDSLGELYRVLRPGGALIITWLPNRLSVEEWYRRVVRKRDYHRRLYGRGEITQLLKRSGFVPAVAEYQTYYRERWRGRLGWLGGLTGVLGPLDCFASCLRVIARKVVIM